MRIEKVGTLLSEELQWDIIDALTEIYPRHLTREEFDEDFGDVDDKMMLVNVIHLIDGGVISPKAILRRIKGPTVNITALLLTPYGYQLAQVED